MSLFSKILEKLGFNRPAPQAAPSPQSGLTPQAVPSTPASPAGITVVDVIGRLEGLAAPKA